MNISNFDVILGMDWLTANRIAIDCDSKRITAYTQDGRCVMFQGDKHDPLPQTVYDSRWHGQLMGWLSSLTLEDEVRQDLSPPRVVCEYEDVFPDELSGLPPHKYVDPVWSLYNIGSCCHVIVHVVFWVELLVQRRLIPIVVKSWVPEKGTRWCGVGLLDIYEYSAG